MRRADRARRHVAGRALRRAHRPRRPCANPVNGRQAELWGDEQWLLLKQVVEERKPKVIGINRSTVFAFSDGLSSGELQGMSEALGGVVDVDSFRDAERLPLELIASRLPEEEAFFEKMSRARLADDADDVLRTR